MKTITTAHFSVDILWETSPVGALESLLQEMLEGLDAGFAQEDRDMELTVHFVDDEKMRQRNLRYRGRDSTTDVLAFPVHEDLRKMPSNLPLVNLGDIIISIPKAHAQAREHSITMPQEMAHLLAHGFLHLLGHDHGDEMFAREAELVRSIYQYCSWEK